MGRLHGVLKYLDLEESNPCNSRFQENSMSAVAPRKKIKKTKTKNKTPPQLTKCTGPRTNSFESASSCQNVLHEPVMHLTRETQQEKNAKPRVSYLQRSTRLKCATEPPPASHQQYLQPKPHAPRQLVPPMQLRPSAHGLSSTKL